MWLKGIVKPRLDKESRDEVDEILDQSNQEEVDSMVSNLGKTLDKIKAEAIKEGRQEGIEKGKLEVAKNLLKMGMDLLTVMQATGLSKEDIEKIKADMH